MAAGVVWSLVRWRPARPVRYAVAEVFLVAGTLPWLWMILTPNPGGTRRVSLIPLRDLASLAPGDVIVQVGGNLLVFAALGALVPIRWPVGVGTVAAFAAGASTCVEMAQYVLDLGRVSSVDDVLVNTLGAVLFALASRPWWRRRARTTTATPPTPEHGTAAAPPAREHGTAAAPPALGHGTTATLPASGDGAAARPPTPGHDTAVAPPARGQGMAVAPPVRGHGTAAPRRDVPSQGEPERAPTGAGSGGE